MISAFNPPRKFLVLAPISVRLGGGQSLYVSLLQGKLMYRVTYFLLAALAMSSTADGGIFIDLDPVSGVARSSLTFNPNFSFSGSTVSAMVDAQLDMVDSNVSSTSIDFHLSLGTAFLSLTSPLSMNLTFNCAQTAAGQTASAGQQMIDYELSLLDRDGNPSVISDDYFIQSASWTVADGSHYSSPGPLEGISLAVHEVPWPSSYPTVGLWSAALATSLDTNFPTGLTGAPIVTDPNVYFRLTATSSPAVPEPSTLLLALFGLALLPRRRRR